jgi:diamine N-acetyltransferase
MADPLDTTSQSLEDLVRELPSAQRAQVRDYVEYLLALQKEAEKPAPPGDPGPEAEVRLREVTAETVHQICRLSSTLTPPKNMVAPNALSIAEAYFEEHAWFRAIYADDTPVGFVMLYDDPDKHDYFLWRLMVAKPHHGKGFGRRAMEQVIDYVRTRPGATVLETSCGQGAGSPEGFYRALGFQRNGKMIDHEVGLSLTL